MSDNKTRVLTIVGGILGGALCALVLSPLDAKAGANKGPAKEIKAESIAITDGLGKERIKMGVNADDEAYLLIGGNSHYSILLNSSKIGNEIAFRDHSRPNNKQTVVEILDNDESAYAAFVYPGAKERISILPSAGDFGTYTVGFNQGVRRGEMH